MRDSGDILLVDAGWSREACIDSKRVFGRVHAIAMGVALRTGDSIADQLVALHLEPSRVKTIVATHLHFDHVGGCVDFPNAEVVCSDREHASYRRFPLPVGYRRKDLESARVRPIAMVGPPSYGFRKSYDFYGDGEVVLLDAAGHTRGHTAVALRSRAGCFVHIGDAAYQSWEYGLSPKGPSPLAWTLSWRRSRLQETYAAIRSCEVDPRKPVIVPSHDYGVFEKLPQGPTIAKTNGVMKTKQF